MTLREIETGNFMVFTTIVRGSRFPFKMFPSNFGRILGLGPGLIIFSIEQASLVLKTIFLGQTY